MAKAFKTCFGNSSGVHIPVGKYVVSVQWGAATHSDHYDDPINYLSTGQKVRPEDPGSDTAEVWVWEKDNLDAHPYMGELEFFNHRNDPMGYVTREQFLTLLKWLVEHQ